MRVILASASLRREKLLHDLGLDIKVIASQVDEQAMKKKIKKAEVLATKLALMKVLAVKSRLHKKDTLIIGADTFVVLGRKILGKPETRREALKMLTSLRNKTHLVVTGLALVKNNRVKKTAEITKVKFRKVSLKEINQYLDTNVFLDRAGAYGIQDKKCDFVKSFKGSYSNILGLPLEKLTKMLEEFGVKIKKTKTDLSLSRQNFFFRKRAVFQGGLKKAGKRL